ncbi:MAG TPA: trypsin-like peptidase domain-containing protein [Thermomicrobiales bacterium]|nr:trypsin-like peptidase domain-containing protein [Thermomicrobiales bacterium]
MARLPRRASGPRLAAALVLVSLALALSACTVPLLGEATPTPTPRPTPSPTAIPTPTPLPTPTPDPNLTPQQIYQRVSPAVVTIVTRVVQGNQRGTAYGTGVILDRRGYIVTNNHVVEGGQGYQVIFSDGTRRDARVVGTDPTTDLAVVQVDGDLPGTASFGDSTKLVPGQPVVAIGSALGEFSNTITTGVISGLHRDLERQTGPTLEGMIQTDAAINPGNSGGPLLNLQAEVIGINTAVIRQSGSGASGSVAEGIGFAIPANLAKVITDKIIASGQVTRPGIGATTVQVTPAVAADQSLTVQQGALVTQVTRGGPFDAAGIQVGDVVIAVEGKQIDKDSSLSFLLLAYKPGDKVNITVARGQERQAVQVTLGPADQGRPPQPPNAGGSDLSQVPGLAANRCA